MHVCISIPWKKRFRKPVRYGILFWGEGVIFLEKAVSFIFLGVFLIVAVVHLIACYPPIKRRLRIVTKFMLMPLLLLCYLTIAETPSPLIILAALFGWFGDAFLLLSDRKVPLMSGILSFGVGHVFYMLYFSRFWGGVPWWALALAGAVYLCGVTLMSRKVHPLVKSYMRPCTTLYMLLLCATSFSILFALLSGYNTWLGVAFMGSMLFLVSDSILSMEYFKEKTKFGNFFVMLSYILAQACILVASAKLGA